MFLFNTYYISYFQKYYNVHEKYGHHQQRKCCPSVKYPTLGRGRGIKTWGGKQWHQSTKSLESGLSEEESNVAAANIVTEVTVTAPQCPIHSLHPPYSKNYVITQKVKKKLLVQHHKTL